MLKQLLGPYHVTCVKNVQGDGMSIVACPCMGRRQIGITQILAIEYGANFNSLNKEGGPDFKLNYDGCDSSAIIDHSVHQGI